MLNVINRSSSLPQLLIKLLLRSQHNLLHIHQATNIQTQLLCILQIFPDSGASIFLAGPQHLEKLRVSPDELIPCFKSGGISTDLPKYNSKLVLTQQNNLCTYAIKFTISISISRKGCMDTNIIPKSFPFPMNTTDKSASITSAEYVEDQQNPSL